MNLPPLPRPTMPDEHGLSGFYTADQMRAYAEAAALAERERCAAVCKDLDAEYLRAGLPGFVLETAAERITTPEKPYCTECGFVGLAYVEQYANGRQYKCKCCGALSLWGVHD